MTVFLVWDSAHSYDGGSDEVVGVYATRASAEAKLEEIRHRDAKFRGGRWEHDDGQFDLYWSIEECEVQP